MSSAIYERIIGVNNIKFFYHEDYRSNRKNVIWISKQFEQIINEHDVMSNSHEYVLFISELFYKHKDKLTDVIVETVGYF